MLTKFRWKDRIGSCSIECLEISLPSLFELSGRSNSSNRFKNIDMDPRKSIKDIAKELLVSEWTIRIMAHEDIQCKLFVLRRDKEINLIHVKQLLKRG